MMNGTFSIASEHRPKDGLTVSTPLIMGNKTSVTAFSLGRGTDISPETYDSPILYIALYGGGAFLTGEDKKEKQMKNGDLLVVKAKTLCGVKTQNGFVYTEIIPKEELKMNNAVKSGEVLRLADLLPYEAGSIVNMDVVSNDGMKLVVMAFDEGTGLSPHRAPGDALIFALEGKATIGYEGEEHEIKAGESFRFDKNGLHSVKANGKFKMALLLVLK